MIAGKIKAMGLGFAAIVSLAEARDMAFELRWQIHHGADPLEARRSKAELSHREAANAQIFKDCAEAYIAANKPGWRNEKHAAQWRATLATYAYPVIGGLPVQKIETAAIMRILGPIWLLKPETANRIQGRVESVLDWATAREFRSGENPARWRGHLDKLLPARSKVRQVEHHPALPYAEIAGFMALLRRGARRCRTGLGVRDPDCSAHKRGNLCRLEGGRFRETTLDHSARAHEGRKTASRTAV